MKRSLYLSLLPLFVFIFTACVAPTAAPAPAQESTEAATPTAAATEATGEASDETPEEATEEAATTPESTPEESTASAAPTECEEGFRLFDHELLATDPVCIPNAPQRVLPLDIAALELVLLTGNEPVATAQWILDELPLLVPEFAPLIEGMEGVGYPADLEQVVLMFAARGLGCKHQKGEDSDLVGYVVSSLPSRAQKENVFVRPVTVPAPSWGGLGWGSLVARVRAPFQTAGG